MSKGFRVTVEDLDSGRSESSVFAPGDYMLLPFAPCYLDSFVRHKNGTVQLTLKSHGPVDESGAGA